MSSIRGAIGVLVLALLATPCAWATHRADAVLLVNSSSPSYANAQRFTRLYLDHFGVPYTVLDLATTPVTSGIGDYALIVIGHRNLDPTHQYLSAAEEQAISAAVFAGTGLVNLDNDLSADAQNPRYQFVHDVFGFSYVAPQTGNGVRFTAAAGTHYVTARHQAGELLTTGSMLGAGITLPGNVTALALTESTSRPWLAVTTYGQGRAVQFGWVDWMAQETRGPLAGLDDLMWRSLGWAARKPFVMQGLPNFLTFRVDDVRGPLAYVQTAVQLGFKPWLGLFYRDLSAADASAIATLVSGGSTTASVHATRGQPQVGEFFYFDHYAGVDHTNAQVTSNFDDATAWHQAHGIPISKFVLPHYYEFGTNVFGRLDAWGVEFVGTQAVPGQPYSGTPWLRERPYRVYEDPWYGGNAWAGTYADFLTVPGHPEFNGRFFNCVTEIRDDAGYEWFPDNNVAATIGRGTRQTKRSFDSMALATLFTHENWVLPITPANWQAELEGVLSNLASYEPEHVTLDYACRYVRATVTSGIASSTFDPGTRILTTQLAGSADIATRFLLFSQVGADGVVETWVDVPPFTGSTQVTYGTFGPVHHVVVTPSTGLVPAGGTVQFTAQGYDAQNTPIPGLNYAWAATAGGTIDGTGLFTAGSTPGTFTNAISATVDGVPGTASAQVYAPVLSDFELDPIPGPVSAGTAFALRVTAYDQQGRVMTSYAGPAQLTDTTGTIAPVSTGSFAAGVWSGSVTISQVATGVTVTVTAGAVNATSNAFNVQQAPPLTVTINCWEDNHQNPVVATTTNGGALNGTDGQWTEFWYDCCRPYPALFAQAGEVAFGLPVMRCYTNGVQNRTYEVFAKLYTNSAGRDMRYFYGYQQAAPGASFVDTIGGAGGAEQFAEYSLGTRHVTNGTFEIFFQDAQLLGSGYPFFGWASVRLVETCSSATWYQDSDGDGYGTSAITQQACVAPPGHVGSAGDCNDTNAAVHPGASDANCNGIDDNCSGSADEAYVGCCSGGTVLNCDDGNACTVDGCDAGTSCTHTPVTCNDGLFCTDDSCNPATGCVTTPHGCGDGVACTNDSCNEGTDTCDHAPNQGACSDGNACTVDSCDALAGCTNAPLTCNDGLFCTDDSCNPATGCVTTPHGCDDGVACTVDGCNEGADICDHAPNHGACNDGNACTDETCTASGCVSSADNANTCSDGNPCTVDTCSAGVCTSTGPSCDDGNPCTDDSCVGGSCVHTADDTNVCSDGNACTAPDVCRAGACVCGQVAACTATTASFAGTGPVTIPTGPAVVSSTATVSSAGPYLSRVRVTTRLRHTANGDLDVTLTSPAGTVITLTSDNGGALDHVFNGTVWDDDANPGGQVPYGTNAGLATDHPYANNVLASTLVPEEALGAFGGENPNGVWTLRISDDTSSNGGTLDSWSLEVTTLSVAPTATTGSVSNGTDVVIPTAGTVSSSISVSGRTGKIGKVRLTTFLTHNGCGDLDVTLRSPAGTVVTLTTDNVLGLNNLFNGTVWDDDADPDGQVPYTTNAGLAGDHPYVNNVAVATLAPEEALAAFKDENPNGTWTLTISDDQDDDGGLLNLWTLEVTTFECVAPTCAANCDDGNACTVDSCDALTGCTHTPVTCNDGLFCTDDSCNPATGCVTTPHGCGDAVACTNDSCNEGTDACDHAPNQGACSDGNACTVDSCDALTGCTNAPVTCNDGLFCTDDSCNPATGCVTTPHGCGDGVACTNDSCNEGTDTCDHTLNHGACNDGNACTDETCTASGCVSSADNTNMCSDGNSCTVDTCSAGVCTSTGPSCDDGNPCTDDSCVGGSCVHTADDTNTCSDGNACTAPDVCRAGACVCGQAAACTGTTASFAGTGPVTIPTGPAVVSSTTTVSGAGPYVSRVRVTTRLRHTANGDLDVTLTSPAGTVITLTSDNGGTLDHVFNGTVWDDDANPGGQVPYGTNAGLATDHPYANNVLASTLVPEEALGAFGGENPNGVWTLRISDDTSSNGGTLDSWSLEVTTLSVAPTATTGSVSNTTDVVVPLIGTVSSSISVSGRTGKIGKVRLTTFLTHNGCGDLDVTLRSPAGTVVTLTTDNLSGLNHLFNGTVWDDDADPDGQVPYTTNAGLAGDHPYVDNVAVPTLAPEEALAAFKDENPNGTWTLTISDDQDDDGGLLDRWTLEVTTFECVATTCAVSCNDGNSCTDDSCNPGSGCVNLPNGSCP